MNTSALYAALMQKSASLAFFKPPTLTYGVNSGEHEEQPPSYKESVEIAARKYFGMPDPSAPQYSGYGVTTSRIGDKQVAPPYVQQAETNASRRADSLKKKWSVPGTKPTTVGSGTLAKRKVV